MWLTYDLHIRRRFIQSKEQLKNDSDRKEITLIGVRFLIKEHKTFPKTE
jgi:hypothetical protein